MPTHSSPQPAVPVDAAVSYARQPRSVDPLEPLPFDTTSPQFTLRAVITGMALGGVLSICNLYAGLKIGWALNMSIPAIVLSYAFWHGARAASGGRIRAFGMLENNINQAAGSAGAAVASAGLVGAIPALTILTGQSLSWGWLALWLFSVGSVGIVVALALRRSMIVTQGLPFAAGLACAETLREMYATGREAAARVRMLIVGAVAGGTVFVLNAMNLIKSMPLEFSIRGASAQSLGFVLEANALLTAVGGLIGFRACASLLLGSIVAWGVLMPRLLETGQIRLVRGQATFSTMVEWLIWPGVTLMLVSSIMSLLLSGVALHSRRSPNNPTAATETATIDRSGVSRAWFVVALLAALALCVTLQIVLFGISWWAAAAAALLSFGLAIVTARIAGEASINPVGAMGKLSQLVLGAAIPSSPASNLMAASVASGAASQCADLMHDFKCGWLLGATARYQAIAQTVGALAGALTAALAYVTLFPNPAAAFPSDSWSAPGVLASKSVAELFLSGFQAVPASAVPAMLIAAAIGILLPLSERLLPNWRQVLPSGASVGLAFVIPARNGLSIFIGGVLALILNRVAPGWAKRLLIVLCAGVIAGESLTGVGLALQQILFP